MNPPNLLALIALESVARHGSVTRAAQELHLTQSAVSHRLRALERELGHSLLERAGRGVRLTDSARELASSAKSAIDQLTQALTRFAPQSDARALAIGCSPSFAIRFLVPRLALFRAGHPQLDLRIAALELGATPARSLDATVRLASGPVAGMRCSKLIDEVVFPVVSPRLHTQAGAIRTPRDLARYTLLHDDALPDNPERIGWATWLARVGETRVDSTRGVRFSHAYLALEAAVAGDGIALARRTLVADDLARGRLVTPFRLQMRSGLSYWFVSASEPKPSRATAVLHDFLRAQLRAAQRAAAKALRAGVDPKAS